MRKIAIGDIHGCSVALNVLLGVVDPQPEDTIITLGDYIDRGPNSKGVIERLIALGKQCNHVPILGNHELMLMQALGGESDMMFWLRMGGRNTMSSYGQTRIMGTFTKEELKAAIPFEHMHFVAGCVPYYEDDNNIFVHANYEWDAPLESQTENAQFWHHIRPGDVPPPHQSGKTVWVGHTPQNGNIWDLGHVVCIDTYVFRPEKGGWLTAVDVDTREIWQANELGELRELDDNDTAVCYDD